MSEESVQSPIAAGTYSYNSINQTSGDVYVLAFVDLPQSDGINIKEMEYVPKTESKKAYLKCKFSYPNIPNSNEVISYQVPLFLYQEEMGDFPDQIVVENEKSGGKNVKVKTVQPTGQDLSPNTLKCNVLINTPDGMSNSYYFILTQTMNDGDVKTQLLRDLDMEAGYIYYSYEADQGAPAGVSTDLIADNQKVFSTVNLMDGSNVLSTVELQNLSIGSFSSEAPDE